MAAANQELKIGISDPISLDIQAICGAITEICKTAQTPEGQATIRAWRESGAVFQSAIVNFGKWTEDFFVGRL